MGFKGEERGSVEEFHGQEAEQQKALEPGVIKRAGGAVKWVEKKKSAGGWVDVEERRWRGARLQMASKVWGEIL